MIESFIFGCIWTLVLLVQRRSGTRCSSSVNLNSLEFRGYFSIIISDLYQLYAFQCVVYASNCVMYAYTYIYIIQVNDFGNYWLKVWFVYWSIHLLQFLEVPAAPERSKPFSLSPDPRTYYTAPIPRCINSFLEGWITCTVIIRPYRVPVSGYTSSLYPLHSDGKEIKGSPPLQYCISAPALLCVHT